MTKKIFLIVLLLFIFQISFAANTFAVFDPLSRNNNYIGIHILFPEELADAARLVNSSGGDWGYVTIPIQIGDRDLAKWQKFMDDCYKYHLIPILRLSTEGYYKETSVWRQPTEYDVLDLSNFLNSLSWPTKNRYIILFNEVNRFDEWGGGAPNPAQYADLVDYSIDAFKRRSDDFYMILGAMDNAAPNDGVKYMDNYSYLQAMAYHNKNVFTKIDGFSSHSYPNPNFAQAPNHSRMGVSTYKFESDFIEKVSGMKKTVFITETGWNGDVIPGDVIGKYYKYSFDNIWNKVEDKIVAITPFVLHGQGGPFDKFSFFKNGAETPYFKAVAQYPKVKGNPEINTLMTLTPTPTPRQEKVLGVKNFKGEKIHITTRISPVVKVFFKQLLGIGWY